MAEISIDPITNGLLRIVKEHRFSESDSLFQGWFSVEYLRRIYKKAIYAAY